MSVLNTRRCEKQDRDGNWSVFNFMNLHKGDVFRLFDNEENPIETGVPLIALEEPYLVKKSDTDDMTPIILCDIILSDIHG